MTDPGPRYWLMAAALLQACVPMVWLGIGLDLPDEVPL